MLLWLLYLTLLEMSLVSSKKLDNRLIGQPSVTCGPDVIRIAAESEEIFEGQVFVKHQKKSSDCYSVYYADQNSTNPEFVIPLNRISSCGLNMVRSAESKALEIAAVFVFAFHPSFVTQGDRAFAVHCVFQQKDYTVAMEFDFIGDLQTSAVIGATASVPTVQLSIVPGRVPDSSENNNEGKVSVGQPLMLVWSLERASEMYGVRVLSCSAESLDGKQTLMLDGGCTMDKALISDVRYSDDFHRGFSDAVAFKFPDQDDVYFKCHVQLCIKKFEHLIVSNKIPNNLCANDHKCRSEGARERRSTPSSRSGIVTDDILIVNGRLRVHDEYSSEYDMTKRSVAERQTSSDVPSTLCMPRQLFSVYSAFSATIYCITIATLLGVSCIRMKKRVC